jgi:hypothetical protein
MRRRVEAIRDRTFRGVGTAEALIPVSEVEMMAKLGISPVTAQWRKPLSIEEINRMAPTVEVMERRGRP